MYENVHISFIIFLVTDGCFLKYSVSVNTVLRGLGLQTLLRTACSHNTATECERDGGGGDREKDTMDISSKIVQK